MTDLILKFFNIFLDKKQSIGKRTILFLFSIGFLILINDFTGFTFYYEIRQQISLIKDIESIKPSTDDELLIEFLKDKEHKIINRKYLITKFWDLFKNEDFKPSLGDHRPAHSPGSAIKSEIKTDTTQIILPADSSHNVSEKSHEIIPAYYFQFGINWDSIARNDTSIYKTKPTIVSDEKPEKKYRSNLWHTVTSGFTFILFSILLLLLSPFIIFDERKFNVESFFVIILVLPIFALLIWLSQFLLGLIPVMFNKPWINYSLNFIVNILFLLIFITSSDSGSHNTNSDNTNPKKQDLLQDNN